MSGNAFEHLQRNVRFDKKVFVAAGAIWIGRTQSSIANAVKISREHRWVDDYQPTTSPTAARSQRPFTQSSSRKSFGWGRANCEEMIWHFRLFFSPSISFTHSFCVSHFDFQVWIPFGGRELANWNFGLEIVFSIWCWTSPFTSLHSIHFSMLAPFALPSANGMCPLWAGRRQTNVIGWWISRQSDRPPFPQLFSQNSKSQNHFN